VRRYLFQEASIEAAKCALLGFYTILGAMPNPRDKYWARVCPFFRARAPFRASDPLWRYQKRGWFNRECAFARKFGHTLGEAGRFRVEPAVEFKGRLPAGDPGMGPGEAGRMRTRMMFRSSSVAPILLTESSLAMRCRKSRSDRFTGSPAFAKILANSDLR